MAGMAKPARDQNCPVILQVSQGGAAFFAGKGVSNDGQKASIAGSNRAYHRAKGGASWRSDRCEG
jgi:fructose/tagatose bisphosphate aldolase